MKLKNFIWIFLGIVALVMNGLFGRYPELYEVLYFNGLFQWLRVIYDYTLGWMPIPMVYLLFIGLVLLIVKFFRFKGLKRKKRIWEKVGVVAIRILSFAGAVIFFFYFLWGFNYQQKTLSEKLDFPNVQADSTELFEESMFMLEKLKLLRSQISSDTLPLSFDHVPDGLESQIRVNLEQLFKSWDLPVNGRVRVRTLYPKGTLLRISTAGVYIPFVFEGHIDAGLHPIQYPFITAHEMSHGYGIADEGTCNFTGFLACMLSEDPMIQYSACMGIWRYMAGNLRRASPTFYKKMVQSMDDNVRRDLIAIMDEMDKYPDILPKIRDVMYDTYLKTHGVRGGMANYSTVVRLIMEWKKSEKNLKLKEKIYPKDFVPIPITD